MILLISQRFLDRPFLYQSPTSVFDLEQGFLAIFSGQTSTFCTFLLKSEVELDTIFAVLFRRFDTLFYFIHWNVMLFLDLNFLADNWLSDSFGFKKFRASVGKRLLHQWSYFLILEQSFLTIAGFRYDASIITVSVSVILNLTGFEFCVSLSTNFDLFASG